MNTSPTFFGKRMPKYLIQESAHLKGKSACSSVANEFGMDMFRASDFWKLTLKLDNLPYALSSDIKLGMEIRGLDIKKSRSSAKAAILGDKESFRCIPDMLGLSLTVRRKGSNAKINIKGDKGHPCLVPLAISKGEDNSPFTFT